MLPHPPEKLQNDIELIADSRAGSQSAFAELWHRHRDAALRTAWPLGRSEAEDIVAEAFTSIWVQIQNGKGPREYFRAYALTTVRNIAVRRYRDRQRTLTGVEIEGEAVPGGDQLLEVSENQQQILAAFEALPDRWQQILWWVEVDKIPRMEIADRLELSPNSVSVLTRRAREGLRIAWMQQQLPDAASLEHADLAYQLPKYVRGGLGDGRRLEIQQHLQDCVQCRGIERDLTQENGRLGGSFVAGVIAGVAALSASLFRPEPALASESLLAEVMESSTKVLSFSKAPISIGAGVSTFGAGAMSLWLILAAVFGGMGGQLPASGEDPSPVGVAAEAAEQPKSTPPGSDPPEQEDEPVEAFPQEPVEVAGSSAEGGAGAGQSPEAPEQVGPGDTEWDFSVRTANGRDGAIAPQLDGTSTPGSPIRVSVGGFSYTVPVGLDGRWSTDLATLPLSPRSHSAVLTREEAGTSVEVGQVNFTLDSPNATAVDMPLPGSQVASLWVTGVPESQACIELGPNVYQRVWLDGSGAGSAQVPVVSPSPMELTVRYCEGSRFGPARPFRLS